MNNKEKYSNFSIVDTIDDILPTAFIIIIVLFVYAFICIFLFGGIISISEYFLNSDSNYIKILRYFFPFLTLPVSLYVLVELYQKNNLERRISWYFAHKKEYQHISFCIVSGISLGFVVVVAAFFLEQKEIYSDIIQNKYAQFFCQTLIFSACLVVFIGINEMNQKKRGKQLKDIADFNSCLLATLRKHPELYKEVIDELKVDIQETDQHFIKEHFRNQKKELSNNEFEDWWNNNIGRDLKYEKYIEQNLFQASKLFLLKLSSTNFEKCNQDKYQENRECQK